MASEALVRLLTSNVLIALFLINSISAASVRCPVANDNCHCQPDGPVYSVKCSSIHEMQSFESVLECSKKRVAILQLDAVRWNFLPLQHLADTSVHTLVVSNSIFRTFLNDTNYTPSIENLQHLSLENVTLIDVPDWKSFNVLTGITVLFIYNSTVKTTLTADFGNNVSSNLLALSLARSNISEIEADAFHHLDNLITLRISHNKLRTFSRRALPLQSKLEQLRLDHNKIHVLQPGTFDDLPHLKLVSLSNNSLSTLPQQVFGTLFRRHMHLELRGNPIKCDCRLKWLVNSPVKPDKIIGSCLHPKRLFGKNLEDLVEADLPC